MEMIFPQDRVTYNFMITRSVMPKLLWTKRPSTCFYSASALRAMQTAVIATLFLSVCPSVRPSRSGIVSRRNKMHARSCGFQRLVR